MDPQKLEELVTAKVKEIAKNAGGLTPEEAKALYASESKKLVEEGFKSVRRNSIGDDPVYGWILRWNCGPGDRYEQESGEKWTPEKQKGIF